MSMHQDAGPKVIPCRWPPAQAADSGSCCVFSIRMVRRARRSPTSIRIAAVRTTGSICPCGQLRKKAYTSMRIVLRYGKYPC